MLRILMVGAALASALILAQREHWLARAGLVGTCQIATAPAGDLGDTAQFWACKQGMLTGYPVLTQHDCDDQGVVLNRQIWRCPTPLDSAPTGIF